VGVTESAFTIHPMVDYLNSLRTQERDTNPSYVHENRRAYLDSLRAKWAGFPEDEDLHVPTLLDGFAKALASGAVDTDAVFLTGDAGDGKTALCAQIAGALTGAETDLSLPCTTLKGWTIVKDASEVPLPEMDALLGKHLIRREENTRLLVAINEGRLRRLFRSSLQGRPALQRVIDGALKPWLADDEAVLLDEMMQKERVVVINFRHRFHVRTVLPGLLATWTRPQLWAESPFCSRCIARLNCPILANAVSLQNSDARDRLADLMTAVHFSGQRLPFRRLQALAALACTGGLKCHQVQKNLMPANTNPALLLRHRYYEAIFPSTVVDIPVPIQHEPLCQAIAAMDPGLNTSRDFDAAVGALVLDGNLPADAQVAELRLEPLERAAAEYLSSQVSSSGEADAEELSLELARFTRSLRRFYAFAGRGMRNSSWRLALALLERYALDPGSPDLIRTVVGALNLLQRCPNRRDTLAERQFDPGGFRNPERLALVLDLGVDFECRLVRGPELPPKMCKPWLESCPSDIRLQAWPRGVEDKCAELALDANLVCALLAVEEGFTQHAGLGAYRRDLARFFSQLVQLATRAGKQPAIGLKVGGQTLRLAVTTNNPPRLQFLRR
jgi:hypothetical protein